MARREIKTPEQPYAPQFPRPGVRPSLPGINYGHQAKPWLQNLEKHRLIVVHVQYEARAIELGSRARECSPMRDLWWRYWHCVQPLRHQLYSINIIKFTASGL